jgi:CRISPR-associated protein Csm2
MREAMKKAGFKSAAGERTCQKCGRVFFPHKPNYQLCPACAKGDCPHFPDDYPDYFDAKGNLKCEYVTDLAENIAKTLGAKKLTMHQLRAFYNHVKRLHISLKKGRPFEEIYPEICKLKPFAEERAKKKKIPNYFREFIFRNVDKAKDPDAFLKGFVEHFQAVVAYCAGTIQER